MYFYVVGSLKYKNQYTPLSYWKTLKYVWNNFRSVKSSFTNKNFMKCTCRSNIPDKNVVN